ncbi:FimV/HubP family polar landmark protein [Candidatus Marithrix sp. Canyon 246]|uniref:FimV/HubP family polar landmark protein n=1 Tax=Candidatus Marithrix sp. Canyon 246 TaxID=1827136 RepID=UPI00084A0BFC|nr:FimV/HubP family polar landmark protein [Candidatus Marithrix sp. Canyon 246]
MPILLLIICILIHSNSNAEAATYGPTTASEDLWHIAKKLSPPSTSVSIYQVILALQKLNPNAFKLPCNINSLKVGVSLELPNVEEMQTITYYDAQEEYNRQNNEWKNRYDFPIECPILVIETTEILPNIEIKKNIEIKNDIVIKDKFQLNLLTITLVLMVLLIIIIFLWIQMNKKITKNFKNTNIL